MSFVAGDTGSKFEATCQDDQTGLPIDLTGSTVELLWKDAGDVLVVRAMTITDGPGGVAEYQFVAAELVAPAMNFEVKIADSSGKIVRSLELMKETVRAVFS